MNRRTFRSPLLAVARYCLALMIAIVLISIWDESRDMLLWPVLAACFVGDMFLRATRPEAARDE